MQKTISIVIPAFNEVENIPLIKDEIFAVFQGSQYGFEIVFVNDGSTDGTQAAIDALASKDTRIKSIEFSRNFGKEAATTAGLQHATGDAAIVMDADLQHPAKLILDFTKRWEEGFDIVVGKRISNPGNDFHKKIASWAYYKIANMISDTEVVAGATDFRLLDRSVINEFNRLTERDRIARGLIDWLGFKKTYIDFAADKRSHGIPSYSYLKLVKLALSSFVAHSLFPLKFAGYLGIFIMLASGLGGVAIFIEGYVFEDALGWHISSIGSLSVLLIFLTGITLACLGLIALYIGNIHTEVSGRPLYIVKKLRTKKHAGM